MEKFLDVLPIILLAMGQLMQAVIIIDHNQRLKETEEFHEILLDILKEKTYGNKG